MSTQRIVTNLWFDTQAEEAAEYYCSIFEDAHVLKVVPYPEGTDKAGTTLVVEFELLAAALRRQLTDGGSEGPCGWCKDRYGLSWQITPEAVNELFAGDSEGAARAAQALFQMKKLDIATLEAARDGIGITA